MIFKLALRNILRQKRRTVLTVLMMVFGYTLLTFSLTFVEGTYGDVITAFTSQSTGHVQIHDKEYIDNPVIYKTLSDFKEIEEKLKKNKNVLGYSPRVEGGGLAFANKKTLGVELVGVDWEKENNQTSIFKRISAQDFDLKPEYSVIIGNKISKILKLKVGEKLALISQGADGSVANDMFKIAGVFKPSPNDDYRIYAHIKDAQEYFAVYGQVHEVAIRLKSLGYAKEFATSFEVSKKSMARPWQEVEADFYRAMEVDKKGNTVSEFIIMFMVAIGVLNTILMSVMERTREFGVLKAIGTDPKRLIQMIITEVQITALISVAFGVVISVFLVWYFSIYGISYSEPITFGGMEFKEMHSSFYIGGFTRPAFVLFATSFLVSLYPCWRVTRISPIAALRDF